MGMVKRAVEMQVRSTCSLNSKGQRIGVDKGMGKGEWLRGIDEGNGVRPVDTARVAGRRRPAGRRLPALMALVFVDAVSLGLL